MAARAGPSARRKSLGPERFRMERADLDCGLGHGPGADSVHHQFLLEHQARRKGRTTIPGKRPPWNGPRRLRRRTGISPSPRWPTAGPTNTACRAGRRISRCRTSRSSRERPQRLRSGRVAQSTSIPVSPNATIHMEIPYTVTARPDTGPLERQGRHLALPRFRSDALRRSLFRLHFSPARCRCRAIGRTAC